MTFITNYKTENFILNTKWESLPEEVKTRAINCAIDLFIALIVGSHGKQFQAGEKLVETLFSEGNIFVIGSTRTYNLLSATMVMGHASNSFDIDDGHNMIKGHPGTSFIAGVLAAALEKM